MKATVLIYTLLTILVASSCKKELNNESPLDQPLLKGKKVLIVYGGWKGHSPLEFVNKITPWLKEEGAELTISDSLGVYADTSFLMTQDLIIQTWTMGGISKPQVNGLLKAVRNGVGFAGCHGGIGDSFRDSESYLDVVEYQYMVGGVWVAHPGGQIKYEVEITDKTDPITIGLNNMSFNSEQYYMLVDPNNKVLATTTFSGQHNSWIENNVMPVVWTKNYDKGRIFYYSVGHSVKDFEMPDSWTILMRGLRWAAEGKKQIP